MISRGWYSFNSSLSIFDDSDRSVSDPSGVFLCIAPRAYSFNAERFKFCNCNSIGALDNFNNAQLVDVIVELITMIENVTSAEYVHGPSLNVKDLMVMEPVLIIKTILKEIIEIIMLILWSS